MRWQIAPDGWLVLALFGALTIILGLVHVPLGTFSLGLMIWLTFIMRVPDRMTPTQADVILAPADGQITDIETVQTPPEVAHAMAGDDGQMTRITIKTSLVDAHLQCAPTDGRIVENFLIPGLFLPFGDMDAVRNDNERREIIIETATNGRVMIVQYGGRFARHLVCHQAAGKWLDRGAALGMIRMAGVTDIFVPTAMKLHVVKGQNSLAAETVLASKTGKVVAAG